MSDTSAGVRLVLVMDKQPPCRGSVESMRQEDVKKLICLSFRDFIFDPKCLPIPQRSLTRHPRAIFLTPSSPQILKSIFSHPPEWRWHF